MFTIAPHAMEAFGALVKSWAKSPETAPVGKHSVESFAAILEAHGIEEVSAHRSGAPDRAILEADVLMIGGGNTFRLLDSLRGLDVLDGVRTRVRQGDCRYMGASAGTNVACPTIATTNDMPICRPPDFEAFGLVPFQVNLHYIDVDPTSTHMGESREERITEFLEENDCRVLALYEGAWLRVSGATARVTGPAHVFGRDGSTSYLDGGDVTDLLGDRPSFGGARRPRRGPGSPDETPGVA